MAAKWLGKEIMNKGLEHFESNGDEMYILTSYTLGQTYAQITGNAANASHTLDAGDFALSDNGNDRRVTVSAQEILLDTTNASPDLHMAVCDSANSEVLGVWEETTDQGITSGNTINVPTATADINQPT